MSRYLLAIALIALVQTGQAAPLDPNVPCDRTVYVFGGPTLAAEGVKVIGSNDFVSRTEVFFRRVCGGAAKVESVIEPSGRLVDGAAAIADRIAGTMRAIALIHFPVADIESGVSVDRVVGAQRLVLEACRKSGAICIVGGQQPVNAFTVEMMRRQRDLEHNSSIAFGRDYLPLYRYFESESPSRRLTLAMDSGDGRHIGDKGHEMLFALYRLRLLQVAQDPR